MNFEPGTEFAQRYRILNVVSRGGAGTVLKAEDSRLGRIVAIKVFGQAVTGQPELAERVLREAGVLARLNHPAIIRLYDSGMYQGTSYLVMEYVEQSLADVLRQGPQRPEYAVAIISQVADALIYAHSKGIIHRDIKPSNILISSDGRVLLSDFGLALPSGLSSLTRTGYVLGTPTYVSPEQAKGLPLDERADIYSLAVVLFELLVGRPPFLGSSPVEIIAQHVESPVPVELLRPLFNKQLEGVLVKALSKEPNKRYATVQELVADLRRALDRGHRPDMSPVPTAQPQPSQAKPIPSAMSTDVAAESDIHSRTTRRLRWPIILGGVLLFVLITIAALISSQGRLAPPLLTATPPPPSPTITLPATITPAFLPDVPALPLEVRWAGLFVVLVVIFGFGAFWIMRKRPRKHPTVGFPSYPGMALPEEHQTVPRPTTKPSPSLSPGPFDEVEYTGWYSVTGEPVAEDSAQEEYSSLSSPVKSAASSDRADQTAPFARYPSSPMPSTRILEQRRPTLALAWLVPITGPNAGQPCRLSDDGITIGRSTECDVSLDDYTVSRNHARIKFEDGRFYLYDLGSSNGTYVNGERVLRHELRDRDETAIGETSFIFKEVATLDDMTADARRRLREFEALWGEVSRSVRHD